jgi:ssDNA-binding Zn-finger/Zn-ribbon topoisomerase 1
MPSYCPECGDEIDHLNYAAEYSEYGNEYGICDPNGDNNESDERNSNDGETNNYEYACPNCEAGVSLDDILDHRPDEDSEDDESDEDVADPESEPDADCINDSAAVIRPGTHGISGELQRKTVRSMECPQCKHINYREPNEAFICENCHKEIE